MRVQGFGETEAVPPNNNQNHYESNRNRVRDYRGRARWQKFASVITLHGKGYAKTKTLAEFYGVSKSEIEKRLREFRLSRDIEVIEWSGTTTLVNVADFHAAVWKSQKH